MLSSWSSWVSKSRVIWPTPNPIKSTNLHFQICFKKTRFTRLVPVCELLFGALQPYKPRPMARNGNVVSDHYLSSEVGIAILKKGGKLPSMRSATRSRASWRWQHSRGWYIGGGFIVFMQVWWRGDYICFRKKAPSAASPHHVFGLKWKIRDNSKSQRITFCGVCRGQ